MKVYKGYKGAGGTQIGDTKAIMTASTDYTVYPSPYIGLAKSESFVLNVYGDILTGAATGTQGYITLGIISGTGKTTNTAINSSGGTLGQTVYIAQEGALVVARDAGSPLANIVLGETANHEFTKVKFTAGAAEVISVTQVVATVSLNGGAPTSTVSALRLYDENGTQIGKDAYLVSNGTATFNLVGNSWEVPAGTSKRMSIKGDINVVDFYSQYASSGSYVHVDLASAGVTSKGKVSGVSGGTSAAVTGRNMYLRNTKPTVAFSGVSSGSLIGTPVLLEFTVTADAADDVDIYGFSFDIALADYATATNLYMSNLKLYEKDITTVLNDVVSTTTDSSTWVSSTVTLATFGKETTNNTETGDIKVYNDDGSALKVISKGESVTFQLKADVTSPALYDSIAVKLEDVSTSDKNAITWGDQVRTSIDSSYVKAIPTTQRVLTYPQ